MAYSDWQDHEDYDDAPYEDHHDHTDSDCDHADWEDHSDGSHGDYDVHADTGAHTDWSDHDDHDDGVHEDWSDAHADWTDEYIDWDDAHSDWTDHSDDEHGDWGDHNDTGHLDWSDAHSDWSDEHQDWGDEHSDWTNHSDAGGPHLDWTDGAGHVNWTDAHTDYSDGHGDSGDPHIDWTNEVHSDSGDPHQDWNDGHTDWGDHSDGGHGDYDVHADAGGPHIDWGDGAAHQDWTDQPHGDWTDHDDYPDHDDSGAHQDWDDHNDDTHGDWTDTHADSGVDEGHTQVTGHIGGKDVSCYIISADIWRDALNGVGRWEMVLDNQAHWWGGAFTVDDDVTIRINGSLMMMGYVDDIAPYIDSKGQYTEYIKVNGRDYGMDLAQLYITQEYVNIDSKLIVVNALGLAGSEINYAAIAPWPGGINYEFDRTFLADGFRDIAKMIDYDFFVQDNVQRDLHFFDIATMDGGAEHTAVDLTSVPGAVANNILRLTIGEAMGFEVKNVIEAYAGDLSDHYTDLNAADWLGGANVTVADDLAFVVSGKGAIRLTADQNNVYLYADLIFPRYSYASLDMSEPNVGRYAAYPHYQFPNFVWNQSKRTEIRLEDVNGDWIQYFSRTLPWPAINPPRHTTANNNRIDEWRYIEFAYGEGTVISPVGTWRHETWQFVGAAVAFDWSQIRTIRLNADNIWTNDMGDYVIFDELKIPAIEVISQQQDAASIAAYGTRMKDIYRPDIKNQVELDDFAIDQLPKYRHPLVSLQITAIGQVDSNYAAQSLDVQAPSSGINNLTPYRIFTLHHSVKLSPLNNEIVGYDFTTEYELVKSQIDYIDQKIEPTRQIGTWQPTRARQKQRSNEARYRKAGRRIR